MKQSPLAAALACGLFLAAPSLAAAQAAENTAERPDSNGWQLSLGAGALTSPIYQGDDDYDLKVLPNVQLRYGDRFFASVQQGIGYRLVNNEDFELGPVAKIAFGREENDDQAFSLTGGETGDLIGLGDIDRSIEVGGFAGWSLGDITLEAEIRQALGGHDGLIAELGARYGGRITGYGPPVFWSAGPNVTLADETYVSAFFGVDSTQSAASGLPEYDAGGGLYSYGLSASAFVPLDREGRWSLVAIAGYSRLAGDAGDAPLVRERGSPDQLVFGAFLSRTFG